MREVGEGDEGERSRFQPRGSAAERSQRHRLQDERHSRGGKTRGVMRRGGEQSFGHTQTRYREKSDQG